MKYNKLVRDKIPEIIKQSGETPVTHIAPEAEYKEKLREKLLEEVNEFLEDSCAEELADVLEVIDALCKLYKVDKKNLEEVRIKKKAERGGFKERIILDETK